jgi:hypothetical protein
MELFIRIFQHLHVQYMEAQTVFSCEETLPLEGRVPRVRSERKAKPSEQGILLLLTGRLKRQLELD